MTAGSLRLLFLNFKFKLKIIFQVQRDFVLLLSLGLHSLLLFLYLTAEPGKQSKVSFNTPPSFLFFFFLKVVTNEKQGGPGNGK
jgi:hypothetical protein